MAKLGRFDYGEAARLIAGLALSPSLHANTIRIDILAHLAPVACRGKDRPDGKNLVEWAGRLMSQSPLAPHEDPIEDVFIACVTCSRGSFRVFAGNTSDKDFWVERFLDLISSKLEFPPFKAGLEEALALLTLSEALADRVEAERYSEGAGIASARIVVPGRHEISDYADAVVFSAADLAALGVKRDLLQRFILTEELRANLEKETLWNSAICRHPLRAYGDGVQFLTPSSVVRALESQLLDCILNTGLGGWMEHFFHINCATLFVNDVAARMGIEPLEFKQPAQPAGMPVLMPYFGQFDTGKPVVIFHYCPALAGVLNDADGHDIMNGDEIAAVVAFLNACAEELEKMPGFSGGLVLFNLVGIRTMLFAFPRWRDEWQMHSAGLPDWLLLTAHAECTAMKLWRLGQQKLRLESQGTELMDISGLVNLYSYWTSNRYRLLRRDMSRSTTMVNLACDFAVRVRAESLQKQDIHCVRSHNGQGWVRLSRHNARPLFAEDGDIGLYADLIASRKRNLVGCVERDEFRWWLIVSTAGLPSELADLAYQIWDCIFSWLGRIARLAEQTWPNLPQSIEFRVNLPPGNDWAVTERELESLSPAELTVEVDAATVCINLGIPRGFLVHFHTPKNVAETKLVAALFSAVARLVAVEMTGIQLAKLTKEIVRNEDARYFHMVEATELEHFLAGSDRPKPLFIGEEDLALAHATLADLLNYPKSGETIRGLGPSLTLLKDAVAKLWEQIEKDLRGFEHTSILAACFAALVEIERDGSHWDLTSRSLLAMHRDLGNVHEVIHDRRSERSRASLANRLLVEIAQYACTADGNKILTETDHRDLLARMVLLLELAHHRDAISFGFMEPKVVVFPNGELGVDEKFYLEVVSRYFTQRSLERTERAAARYDRFYPEVRKTAEQAKSPPPAVFELDRVFVPEFGFGINRLLDLRDLLRHIAVESKTAGGIFTENDFEKILGGCGFTAEERSAFLARFTLPKRTAWNADFPPRSVQHDVYPWRFRRQLSLLARPLIELTTAPRTWFVSIPMVDQAFSYLVGNVNEGNLPEAFFSSPEMRRYVGEMAQKRGHAFAREVEAVFVQRDLKTSSELEMSTLGAAKKDGLGDLDVLAWDPLKGRIYAVECKCLRVASTMREVVQRLEDFKGDRKEKDSLGRHLRRVDWLKAHMPAVAHYTGISESKIRLVPLLVTNETVPMQFFKDMNFPPAQVVPMEGLSKILSSR